MLGDFKLQYTDDDILFLYPFSIFGVVWLSQWPKKFTGKGKHACDS